MGASKDEGHRGKVKDPESDGRLKENRESGRTKSATEASQERAGKHGRASAEQGQESRAASKSESEPRYKEKGGEAEDLKSREYKDEQGNIHHHTKTYMEQHREQPSKKQ